MAHEQEQLLSFRTHSDRQISVNDRSLVLVEKHNVPAQFRKLPRIISSAKGLKVKTIADNFPIDPSLQGRSSQQVPTGSLL